MSKQIKIRIIDNVDDIRQAERFLNRCVLIANDVETIPDYGLITVNGYSGIANSGETRTYVFPWYLDKNPKNGIPDFSAYSIDAQRNLNSTGIPFTFHNGPYDLFYHLRYHMPVANYAHDSMTMFWSMFPELPKRLDFVSSIILDDYQYWKGDRKSDSWSTYLLYNGKDCDRTLRNTLHMMHMLSHDPRASQNYIYAHLRVIACLAMSMRGMRIDLDKLDQHAKALETKADAELEKLRFLIADPEFNPNSVPQKTELLYKLLGAKPRSAKGRIVKIDDASTGAIAMRAMRQDHPIIARIVNQIMATMEPAKQISNVIQMPRSQDDRIYTTYHGTGTTTTRLSSTKNPIQVGTNLQNIRAEYRDVMVAEPGHVLMDMDLSAGDDVFVSFESGDPRKIELFRSGRDAHAQNATIFFPHWEYDAVVKGKKANDPAVTHPITGIRQVSKKVSHGCNYLMAGMTLLMTAGREAIVGAAKELGFHDAGYWTSERLISFCGELESRYRAFYTRFKRTGDGSWYNELKVEVIQTGGFTTPFGYFQRFLSDPNDDSVLRAVAATAGQAGTAGRINMAMMEMTHGVIPQRFRDAENPHRYEEPLRVSPKDHGVALRLQTHDSFTWDIDLSHRNWQEGVARIFTIMQRPVVIRNKLTGDYEVFTVRTETSIGQAWGKKMVEIKDLTPAGIQLALQ